MKKTVMFIAIFSVIAIVLTALPFVFNMDFSKVIDKMTEETEFTDKPAATDKPGITDVTDKTDIPIESDIIKTYDISYNLSNVTLSQSYSKISSNDTLRFEVTPKDGYSLPNTISVTGAYCNWNYQSGVLILKNPTDNVVVTVEAVENSSAEPDMLVIDERLTGVTARSYNPTKVEKNGTVILKYDAIDGYTLPQDVIVAGADSSWDMSTGTLIIYGASGAPSGNIEVTVTGVLLS